jgi:probable F420-dependent oxidoreductase
MRKIAIMKIGLVYPQTEYGNDPSSIRVYAQTAEELGFTHILAYDHILGASPDHPNAARMPYTIQHAFQEPLALFAFMAGVTRKIEFATGIIILPQRQTALFAKQAATLDVLSGGRLRVGVGLGWNDVEYAALNEDFHTRGARIEEQVQVLRLLWTQPLVEFRGRWHNIPKAGLNPLPLQRPIPIWFGGSAETALRRAARLGNGWMTNTRKANEIGPALEIIHQSLEQAGKSFTDFGLEVRIPYGQGDPALWNEQVEAWKAVGATHLSFNTMGSGFDSPTQHLQAIQAFAGVVSRDLV